MKTKLRLLSGVGFLFLVFAATSYADFLEDEIAKIFDDGKVNLDVRARYENTTADAGRSTGPNPDGSGKEQDAFSVRTRLGFTTADYYGFTAKIEMEDVSLLDDDHRHFLDTATTELNELFLAYKADEFSGKLGRQVYTLDDHRFVGDIVWRQNIQTFDAITGSTNIIPTATLNLGYIDQVNRVDATSEALDGYILNLAYEPADYLKLVGFGYWLDFSKRPTWSSDTFGFRATGKVEMDDVVFNYAFSSAIQTDNSGSPSGSDFDLAYYRFDLGSTFYGFSLGIGAEILEGDGAVGFSTPLSTIHKFNGFADVFAVPGIGGELTQGLEDYYINAGYRIPVGNGIPVKVIYHWFENENNGEDLGQEFNLLLIYKINKYLTAIGKYADYSTDNPTTVTYGTSDQDLYALELNFNY